jgi:hypothetical protein
MIDGVILLRTDCQFNGWGGQAKGRKRPEPVERCLACEAVGVATRRFAALRFSDFVA